MELEILHRSKENCKRPCTEIWSWMSGVPWNHVSFGWTVALLAKCGADSSEEFKDVMLKASLKAEMEGIAVRYTFVANCDGMTHQFYVSAKPSEFDHKLWLTQCK